MSEKILITGGAGFIGSHVADRFLQEGHDVRVLDCLEEQVHTADDWPDYLNANVERVRGTVGDKDTLIEALDGVDRVVHLAAAVGVGQSMYEIARYTEINNMGTAHLMEALIDHPVKKLVVASSMSIYGEGLYQDVMGRPVSPGCRPMDRLQQQQWELTDSHGDTLKPIPTSERKCPDPSSVYALGKYDQEKLCLLTGKAYDIETVALRFFNVYGPRQSLSNPYTGVLAIFASRLLNDKAPLIFEDGRQKRDFVSVYDVARGVHNAAMGDAADETLNIGSGEEVSILEIAQLLQKVLDKPGIDAEITGKYRVGDVRNCFADISKAERLIGYRPQVSLHDGVKELAGWLEGQVASDQTEKATTELQSRGLAF